MGHGRGLDLKRLEGDGDDDHDSGDVGKLENTGHGLKSGGHTKPLFSSVFSLVMATATAAENPINS